MRFICLFLAGFLAFNVPGADVLVNVRDFSSGIVANRTVTVTLTKPQAAVAGSWVFTGDAVAKRTDASGQAWFSNMVTVGEYRLDVSGNPSRSYPFNISSTNGTYNVIQLFGTNQAVEMFYDTAQVDALVGGVLAASTNGVVAGTNMQIGGVGVTGVRQVNLSNTPSFNGSYVTNLLPDNMLAGLFRFNNEFLSQQQFDANALFTNGLTVSGGSAAMGALSASNVTVAQYVGQTFDAGGTTINGSGAIHLNTISGGVLFGPSAEYSLNANGNVFASNYITAANGGKFIGNGSGITNFNQTQIVTSLGTNFTGAKLLSAQTGGNYLSDFIANPVPNFNGQLGLTFNGDNSAALFVGFTNTVGGALGNYWWAPISFPAGTYQIGHPYLMRSNTFHTVEMYFNGNPFDSKQSRIRGGSDLFIYQLNPWNDFNGICIPMTQTNNLGGRVMLTNADNIPIYLSDEFGIQFGCVPPQDPVGETNQAGAFCLISQSAYPFYISVNTTIPNETVAQYSQKPYFAASGATSGTRAHTFSIPKWVPYVWHMTNQLWKDIIGGDYYTGSGWAGSNWYVSGLLKATNEFGGQHVIGPNWPNLGNPNVALFITTNCAIGPGTDVANVLGLGDYSGSGGNRLGVVKQQGSFAKFAFGSGAQFIISQSSAADLFSSPDSQTLTDVVTIDSSRRMNLLGASNYVSSYINSAGSHNFTTNLVANSNPDMALGVQTFRTNTGPINIFAPINVDGSGKFYQKTTVFVNNTGASDQAIRLGGGNYITNTAGTVMRVTNWTEITIDIMPGQWTNLFCKPRS
jgi:hypothetical protein